MTAPIRIIMGMTRGSEIMRTAVTIEEDRRDIQSHMDLEKNPLGTARGKGGETNLVRMGRTKRGDFGTLTERAQGLTQDIHPQGNLNMEDMGILRLVGPNAPT